MKTERLALAAVAIAALAVLGMLLRELPAGGQAAPALIRAQAFELVDRGGHVRAQLKTESSGEVLLRLRDAKGTLRVKLGAGADGSGIVLNNENTEPGVHILATRARTSLVLQRDKKRRVLRP